MMNYLSQKFSFTNYFVKSMEENKQRKVEKYEMYFDQVYKILSWENNCRTLIMFLIVNFVFWIVVQWQVKIFGFLFSIMLVIFIFDSYCENKNPTGLEAENTGAYEEISIYSHDVILNLKILRRENPSLFCAVMSIIFLFIGLMARNTNGYVLIYLTILGTFFLPLIVKFMPDEYLTSICNTFKSLTNPRGVLAEEELFISDKDMKDADMESSLTDKTADSVSNSLMSGISAMPSYMDFPEIPKDIDEDDLIPSQSYRKYTPDHSSSSSDSDSEVQELEFDSSHFATSSDEEKCLEKGLHFTSDSVDNTSSKLVSDSAGLSGVLTNIAHLGGNLVANVLKSNVTTDPEKCENSSSDSDFEIINTDEL